MAPKRTPSQRLLHGVGVAVGAVVFSGAFFMVLPWLQAMSAQKQPDVLVRPAPGSEQEPPSDLPEPEPPPPEEEQEDTPELEQDAPLPDLHQLELALNPGAGGVGVGSIAMKLDVLSGGGDEGGAGLSLADLDQDPRVIYPVDPEITPDMARRLPMEVVVKFIVDENGKVERPMVAKPGDPAFDKAALDAIRQWKFEPGRKKGVPAKGRMRQRIVFPKES